MAARKKKPPWNAGKKLFPELQGGPPHKPPPPVEPYVGPMGLTTGDMVAPEPQWECLRCERILDGREPLVEAPEHTPRCPYNGTGRDPEPRG